MSFSSGMAPWKSSKLWVGVAGVLIFLGMLLLLRNSNFLNNQGSIQQLAADSASTEKNKNGGKVVKPFIPQPDESVVTGYIARFDSGMAEGSGRLLIDNGQNSFNVKVAIYSLNETGEKIIRVCAIRRGEQFILNGLNGGKYSVRFRNLNTGKCFRAGDAFNLQTEGNGSIKLYNSPAGTSTVAAIGLSEFEPPNLEL